MTTVTLDQMRDSLVDMSELERRLSATEPLSTQDINSETRIRFRLQPGWEASLDATPDTGLVEAFITIGGTERQMTKEAALQATSAVGLPQALVRRSPSTLIEPFLDHYWNGLGSTEYKSLTVGDTVSAFTKGTIVPFSNLDLLEQITEAVHARYGSESRIFADYKFQHSLIGTDIRLILPDVQETIQDSFMHDVPTGQTDLWFGGLHLRNSLVGKGQTTIEPYLFRWWCTNGATTERTASGAWSRQGNGGQDLENVYEWARRAVDEVLDGMEREFESVQALTQLSISGNTAEVLGEVFDRYSLPVSQRESIRENIEAGTGPLTMYSLMQAITRVANEPDIDPSRADRLMRIGGSVPSTEFDPLKARVWREGHAADEMAQNPYEVHQVTPQFVQATSGGRVSGSASVTTSAVNVLNVAYSDPTNVDHALRQIAVQ